MKASKELVRRRVEDLVQPRLDGAFLFSQIREYVIGQSQDEASPWHRPEGKKPLSDTQLRRYVQRADRQIDKTFDRSRKRLVRRHIGQRRSLFARAVTSGELSVALAI